MYRRKDDRSGMVARQRMASFIQLQSARKSILDGKEVGRNVYWWQKKTFRVVPSIISAGRNPISLISTHLSLIIHCIRKRIPSPTRCILFQVTQIINMLRASTYSKTQNEEEQVDQGISSCRYGATTASLPLPLSLAIHGIRLDRLLARRQIQIQNKLCAVWRCLAKVSSILKSQQRDNRFVCLPCRTPIDISLGGLHSTSESLRLCSRQRTSSFLYLKCAVRLFSGAAKRSALQVWSCSGFGLRRACSSYWYVLPKLVNFCSHSGCCMQTRSQQTAYGPQTGLST